MERTYAQVLLDEYKKFILSNRSYSTGFVSVCVGQSRNGMSYEAINLIKKLESYEQLKNWEIRSV